MNRLFFLLIIFISIPFAVFSLNDSSSDKSNKNSAAAMSDSSDDQWLKDYISLDPSDDLYSELKSKRFKIKKSYVESLKWNPYINLYIDEFDKQNLPKNSNILPWFPYIFMPYGGYSYNRGADIGFLYRMDNIENTMMSFTTATSFGQKNKFWQHFNMEYPNILKDNRLKLLWTFSIFTSAPQYYSSMNYYNSNNSFVNLFNRIWKKLDITFNQYNETGIYFIAGADYRIPFIDVNWVSLIEFIYNYNSSNIVSWTENSDGTSTPVAENKDQSNFSFNLSEVVRWTKLKQTSTIPVGNLLSAKLKFYIPTSIGTLSSQFRFKSTIEEKFSYKFFREFTVKTRLLLTANYNISEDFSGDPFIRGYVYKELTGFFALLGNFELYIPLIDISINEAANVPLKKDAKFLVYLNMFVDCGFTIDNYDFLLENFAHEKQRSAAIYTYQTNLGNNYALIPALSAGGSLIFSPYFLNFVIRLDVGANILKSAIYNQTSIEVVLSFSEMF